MLMLENIWSKTTTNQIDTENAVNRAFTIHINICTVCKLHTFFILHSINIVGCIYFDATIRFREFNFYQCANTFCLPKLSTKHDVFIFIVSQYNIQCSWFVSDVLTVIYVLWVFVTHFEIFWLKKCLCSCVHSAPYSLLNSYTEYFIIFFPL